MKNVFAAVISMLPFCNGYAQQLKESEIPALVKAKFVSLYPGTKNVKWEKEDNKYEAGFKQDKTETSVLIDATGNMVETETEIAVSSLPQAVAAYVLKNLAGKKIKEASKIVSASGVVMYEAEVDGVDYIFDANGNFIKKETDEPQDKEDD